MLIPADTMQMAASTQFHFKSSINHALFQIAQQDIHVLHVGIVLFPNPKSFVRNLQRYYNDYQPLITLHGKIRSEISNMKFVTVLLNFVFDWKNWIFG